MFTCDPSALRQIAARRDAFPKPTKQYKILSMFGENVVTTEGPVWRMHRKITAASFNEKNAAHTFAEAASQTESMIATWIRPGRAGSGTINSLENDTMTLALNIIGSVGFGLRLLWPGQSPPADMDPKLVKYGSLVPPAGYSMSFADALATTLDNIIALLIIPWGLLRRLPFKWAKVAVESKNNFVRYMDDFLLDKVNEVRRGEKEKEGMDIMGQLVRSKYGKAGEGGGSGGELSDQEIIGNAFMIIVAGHETTAGTLHFTLLELANNPEAQRALQRDIDGIFGRGDPATWDYEQSVNALLAGHVGACMNETLRMLPAVIQIPKHVTPSRDQVLAVDGKKHVLAADMTISMCVASAQRNPRYWPTRPSRLVPGSDDANDYVPERWFRASDGVGAGAGKEAGDGEHGDTENYGGFEGPDTSASLFRPARGSFIPFSDGARSCLGRRIAQVEMIAAIAVIFQRYSVELAVDEWASDAEVDRMGPEERKRVYAKAQAKSRKIISTAHGRLTLKLHGTASVPVRVVRRGSERFVHLVDT